MKGINVRETANGLLIDGFLQDASGQLLTSGTTSAYLYEVQSNATLKSYDFNDNTFKTTTLTTETQALTYRKGNNGATDVGYWSYMLTTLTGFTAGGIYLIRVSNPGMSPPDQLRKFQFGSAEGDMTVTTTGYLRTNAMEQGGQTLLPPLEIHAVINDAGASTTAFKGDNSLSSADDYYNGAVVAFPGNAANVGGLCRKVTDYIGSTRQFLFSGSAGAADEAWPTAPANTTPFAILGRIG